MAKQPTKRKGRLPKAVAEKKQLQGKRMYINGLSHNEIADITDLHIETVKNWSKTDDWDAARKMHSVSIGEMKAEILNTFHDIKLGKKPKLSADAIRKLVAAFQDLNDGRKNAAYAIENYNILTDALIAKSKDAKTIKEKTYRLGVVKYVSTVMQEVANQLYKDAIDD